MVNKTPLSTKTNQIIGGKAPSAYLAGLEKEFAISPARLDEILASHVIDPTALRANDFQAFFAARWDALLVRIERAMGTEIAREDSTTDAPEEFAPDIEVHEARDDLADGFVAYQLIEPRYSGANQALAE